MRKLLAGLAAMVFACVGGQALGQGSTGTNLASALNTNRPSPLLYNSTNSPSTMASQSTSNKSGSIVILVPSPSSPGQMIAVVLPATVEATIQQFQESRQTMMNQLESANEAQRQAILAQLEQLRQQTLNQTTILRERAQGQFGNNRIPRFNQGAPPSPGGGPARGGRPRP